MTLKSHVKFEEKLPVVWKMTWGFWKIFIRAFKNLKNLNFNGLLLTKVYNVWAKKNTEELLLIALQIDAKFERKMTCTFENDMKNLANFHQSTFENLKFGTFIGSFYPSRKCMSLKVTEELCVTRMKNSAKFEEDLTYQFKIDMRNLANFDPSTWKFQKFEL